MAARRALVLGGTGMLSGVAAALLDDGWDVVLPSRRKPLDAHGARWVAADWTAPADLAATAGEALGGPADLLVAWVHRGVRVSVLRSVAHLLADGAPVVEVHGSASANPLGGCPEPVLTGHPTQQVVLGYVRHAGRTRWLAHEEVSAGVLDAVHRALEGRPPHVHQVGEFRPVHS
jgi:hypothetical protein